MGIEGITDGPGGPEVDAPKTVHQGPLIAAAPKRPEGPSTFMVVATQSCQFCKQTMDFLGALHKERGDFQVAVLDANQHPGEFRKIQGHTRRTTVPQIFLDGGFVGGWDELARAAKLGKLDAYLDGEEWTPPKRRWWQPRF